MFVDVRDIVMNDVIVKAIVVGTILFVAMAFVELEVKYYMMVISLMI